METDGKIRRSWKNYLIEPEIQMKRAYYFVAFFFCMVGGLIFWIYFQLVLAVDLLEPEYGLLAMRMTDLLRSLSWFTIVGYLGTGTIASLVFGIYSSHRVIGPSVAIRKHIEKMKQGDYSSRLHIRQGDELVTVARMVNELTDALRQKYGK